MADEQQLPTYQSRDEVPQQYKWDYTHLFADDEAFEAALAQAQDMPAEYASWEGRATASGQGLLDYLRFDDEATMRFQRLFNYTYMRADEDLRDGHHQDLKSRMIEFDGRIQTANAWFQPALLAIPDQTLEEWYATTPGLGLYRLAIDRMRALRDHTLSPEGEAILARASELAEQPTLVFSQLDNADLTFDDAVDSKGEHHPVTVSTYSSMLFSHDRGLRESAYRSLYAGYRKVEHTEAALLASQFRMLRFFAQSRGYASSLEASLVPTEVPVEVYGNLIESCHRHLEPLHKYAAIRKRALGLDKMGYWDVYVPIVHQPEHVYTFEEACEIMYAALAPLGEDYVAQVRRGVEKRWIDVYPTPGKASGAYSMDGHGMEPNILLNFDGTLNDVYTLVHEMGHSMQTYLSNTHQPPRYQEYAMFVAEVASTTNECLLTHYLMGKATTAQERAFLVDRFCEQFRSTLYRQTLFAEFERDANEACARGEGMGADALCRRYGDLNALYYGPDLVVDDEISREWERIPHYYMNFYIYIYATSFAAAVALSERMLREGQGAVDDYLGFLSGGCSKTPIDLLRGAGVDMASGEAVDQALEEFARMVDELDELI